MISQEEDNDLMTEDCVFYKRKVATRGHHVVPRCKGGAEILPTCLSCEDFIHQNWSHYELHDGFNTVEKILADARFQRFLRWLHKQHETAFFRSDHNRSRNTNRYRWVPAFGQPYLFPSP